MDFDSALNTVRTNAAQFLADASVMAVAVGRKDAGPITDGKDFCVTAFVKQRMTLDALKEQGIRRFERTYASAAGIADEDVPKDDIDIVETGTPFEPFPHLSVPSTQRGLYGGNPPALNAQK